MSIVELKVPTIGESITEVTLSAWLKEDGAYVELDDPICEFESDKATLEFPSEASGKLIYVAEEGQDLEVGELVAKIDTSVEAPDSEGGDQGDSEESSVQKEDEEGSAGESQTQVDSESQSYASGHPAPAAQKILDEKGIDPATVKGTGRDGRITKEDAQKATQPEAQPEKEPSSQSEAQPQTQPFSREERTEKMSRMRRTIAKRLVSAKNGTAMLTTFNEADMSAIMDLRKTYQEKFVEKYGIKLGFMSLFAKACAVALQEMPQVNARIDGDNLIYHDYVDISIAVSTPNGLVVPPVNNVESLNFHEIELKIKELADKAREGTLSLEEMTGGTFTITNGGIFGSMMSTPILNEPQSAILGMHNIIQRPVAIDGEVKIRPMMYLALSYDHRVIDGSTSVTFLVRVKELLENPVQLMMGI
ncbi:2-oxoglutarate dehydrogenase complex dihydrolipoyllysine-residue succinyltransferase [Membranicola marinus]|uniref:Dihydrolipoyllysine-residue succinyltransferase component of 2-oxoglutarate dehydrogenase complex n=1 Tax=Membranihabitans marinus TaxID=1227546 RepID=A0A953HRL7_9BACT|nr:2-oxoglutarate dehydrogenase complex dihydrolipoyllysine-residue succinyltransferase [Membranihabitans marinus]MBY5959989.1 2-oxoglutarate dehydrogenase complex dihydrolipoyllysine-residue succinyltransferase [Membranihabitans marinus]